jgi:hypothetical protein
MRFVAMITFNMKTNRIRISGRDIHGDQNLIFKETVILVCEEVRRADKNTEERERGGRKGGMEREGRTGGVVRGRWRKNGC